MDRYRFFVERVKMGRVELAGDQGHHALHVLRLENGEVVEVFDGKGAWGVGAVEVSKRAAWVDVTRMEMEERPGVVLTLATAVPKADRAQWLVEQASQLNVGIVQWVDAARGVVKPREGGGKMEKFEKLAVESAKQCGRNWVMEVKVMRPVLEVAKEAAGRGEVVWWMAADEGGMEVMQAMGQARAQWMARMQKPGQQKDADSWQPLRITALIGPEGGWSEEEAAALAAMNGAKRVRLTRTILRVETACVAVAAVVGMG